MLLKKCTYKDAFNFSAPILATPEWKFIWLIAHPSPAYTTMHRAWKFFNFYQIVYAAFFWSPNVWRLSTDGSDGEKFDELDELEIESIFIFSKNDFLNERYWIMHFGSRIKVSLSLWSIRHIVAKWPQFICL